MGTREMILFCFALVTSFILAHLNPKRNFPPNSRSIAVDLTKFDGQSDLVPMEGGEIEDEEEEIDKFLAPTATAPVNSVKLTVGCLPNSKEPVRQEAAPVVQQGVFALPRAPGIPTTQQFQHRQFYPAQQHQQFAQALQLFNQQQRFTPRQPQPTPGQDQLSMAQQQLNTLQQQINRRQRDFALMQQQLSQAQEFLSMQQQFIPTPPQHKQIPPIQQEDAHRRQQYQINSQNQQKPFTWQNDRYVVPPNSAPVQPLPVPVEPILWPARENPNPLPSKAIKQKVDVTSKILASKPVSKPAESKAQKFPRPTPDQSIMNITNHSELSVPSKETTQANFGQLAKMSLMTQELFELQQPVHVAEIALKYKKRRAKRKTPAEYIEKLIDNPPVVPFSEELKQMCIDGHSLTEQVEEMLRDPELEAQALDLGMSEELITLEMLAEMGIYKPSTSVRVEDDDAAPNRCPGGFYPRGLDSEGQWKELHEAKPIYDNSLLMLETRPFEAIPVDVQNIGRLREGIPYVFEGENLQDPPQHYYKEIIPLRSSLKRELVEDPPKPSSPTPKRQRIFDTYIDEDLEFL